LAVEWSVPAWVDSGTGRWKPCNALARTLHARRTSEVDAALREAAARTASGVPELHGTSPGLRFLALALCDAAGRPAGTLVTAEASADRQPR
jgi:hypothetical protein